MNRRTRRFLPVVLLSVLLALPGALPWAQSASDSEGRIVAAYAISHGVVQSDPAVSAAAADRRYYDLVEMYVWNALPPDAKAMISRLELFVSTSSAEDATDGTATENDDGVTWTLALDEGEGESAVLGGKPDDRAVFDEVIAHEVGHVLSLNESQRADTAEPGGYADSEGSFTRGAYLSRFYARFWRSRHPHGSARQEADQASARLDGDPDAFVTDYAATDPSEDFAESFAYFVLGSSPRGSVEKDRKIEFFYDYPDLVRDRDYLRRGLSSTK